MLLPRLRFPEMKLGLLPPGLCLFSERRGPTALRSVNTPAAQNKAGKRLRVLGHIPTQNPLAESGRIPL